MSDEWPKPCLPTALFYETFPGAVKNARGYAITGSVLRPHRTPGCYRVKWDHLNKPWVLHEIFFTVVPGSIGEHMDIPEDLLVDARALVRHLEAMPSEGNVRLAASMLLAEREAERERCAKIAAGQQTVWDDGIDEVGSVESGIRSSHAAAIASAIRRGTA